MRQATLQRNPECPAIQELANTLEACLPSITLLTTNNASPGTRHTAGLAIDIMLDVTRTQQRQLAHGIIDVLVRRHASMLWSDLIYSDYDGRAISYFHIPARGGFAGPAGMLRRNPYTADTRHGDHIHLDWVDLSLKSTGAEYQRIPYRWSAAARTVGFGATLAEDLQALPSASSPAPEPAAATPAWLSGWWQVVWRGEAYYYFFHQGGQASYIRTRPVNVTQAPTMPQDTGTYTMGLGDEVTIRWNATGTVERLRRAAGSAQHMSGTWNGVEQIEANKL